MAKTFIASKSWLRRLAETVMPKHDRTNEWSRVKRIALTNQAESHALPDKSLNSIIDRKSLNRVVS